MSYKQQLYLDSNRATLINGKYRFDVRNFRISEYKLKKYVVYNISMTDVIYVCCEELAKATINRNSDCGLPSDIIGVVTDQFHEIDADRHTMFLENEKFFKHLNIYFKKSDGTIVNPSSFLVVLDISKES